MMKKLMLILVLVFVLALTACGKEENEATKEPVSTNHVEKTNEPSVNTDTPASEVPSGETTDEPAPLETTEPTPEPTPEPTKKPEKTYDVYVNGIGLNIGDQIDVKVSLKADDKEFTICCPSLNFYKEGVKDAEKIEAAIYIDEDNMYEHPELFASSGDCDYKDSCFSLWSYYHLIAQWDNPDAPPMDITDGVHIFTYTVTFKEAGYYSVDVTSGNGYEDMKDEFAKYDNCFLLEIIKK